MIEKKRAMDPAVFFLIAGLFFGLLYSIAIPYGAGFDEERHLVRIYHMSFFQFIPNYPDLKIHKDVFDLSYQRRLVQTPAFDMFDRENFSKRFSKLDEDIRYGQRTNSIYSPVIFLPQALIGRLLWWRFDFPILPTIILQKIAGMLMYLAGGYVAIRMVPYGKWILTALALAPAAMFQAATLNADGFTNAASFVFIACVLAVYADEHAKVQPRAVWTLIGAAMLLGVAKPGAIILLPLLLILWRHRFASRGWIVVLVVGILLAVVVNVGWAAFATRGSVFSGEGVQSVESQSGAIFSDPFGFIKLLLQGMILTLPRQIQGWMAAYGYWAGTVPGPVYIFFALFIVAALLAEPRTMQVTVKTRIFLAGLFLVCYTAIYTLAFAPNYVTGGVLALAKHGRYVIPFAPLFFLGLAGLWTVSEKTQKGAQWIAIAACVLTAGWFTFGIYTTYYTYCGYDAYMGGKCVLPIYKNLEKEDTPNVMLQNGVQASQTFTKFCGTLESVQVYIAVVPENADGQMRVSVYDEQKQLIGTQDFPIAELIVGDYVDIPVKGQPDRKRASYEVRLEALNVPPPTAIQVGGASMDYYPGELTVNGAALPNDLLIHYVCAGP